MNVLLWFGTCVSTSLSSLARCCDLKCVTSRIRLFKAATMISLKNMQLQINSVFCIWENHEPGWNIKRLAFTEQLIAVFFFFYVNCAVLFFIGNGLDLPDCFWAVTAWYSLLVSVTEVVVIYNSCVCLLSADKATGYGPVFEEQPVDTIYPEESPESKITMNCRARASPPVAYK